MTSKPKAQMGRPTKYKAEFAEQAYKYCLLGADDKKLAYLFEVSESTINQWKKDHKDFSEAIKRVKKLPMLKLLQAYFTAPKVIHTQKIRFSITKALS